MPVSCDRAKTNFAIGLLLRLGFDHLEGTVKIKREAPVLEASLFIYSASRKEIIKT